MVSEAAAPLGEFVELVRGTTYIGALVGKPGPALLGLGSIRPGGGFRDDDFKTYGGDCPQKLMLTSGDLFASLKGATKDGEMIGSVARVPTSVRSGRLTQDTVKLVFRRRDNDFEQYVYWVLRTPQYRAYCAGRATGSAVVALSREDFLAYPIPSPTAARVHCVRLLESIEQRIALLRQTNSTLESIAQALFKSWFVNFDPVRAKAEGREPEGMDAATAALFPAEFEESALGLIPKGWRVQSIGDVATVTKGKSYKSEELSVSDTALVTLKSFERGGGFRRDGFKDYVGSYKPEQVVVPGECIIAFTDVTQNAEVIGRAALVEGSKKYARLVASLDVGILRPNSAEMDASFLYFLLKEERYFAHIGGYTSGTTVLHLAKDGVPAFRFVLPPEKVLSAFADIARSLLARRATNIALSEELNQLRDTLLPRLISGKLPLLDTEAQIEEAIA